MGTEENALEVKPVNKKNNNRKRYKATIAKKASEELEKIASNAEDNITEVVDAIRSITENKKNPSKIKLFFSKILNKIRGRK